jgi:tRNA(Arg) A34 adenosine deaminase TadA
VTERHRIYCGLLMALVRRFWNGNNKGPIGLYPWRERQKESAISGKSKTFRYRGDRVSEPDSNRINWDRYLGHNIACLAVDGRGEVIDFDFNHNHIFRSSVEHAEARIVRRLFSLTSIFDNWQTGRRIPGKAAAFSLRDVTIYTSLESCAQCAGIMALGRVNRVVYLQNDPGQYRVGNIMFNLAGFDNQGDPLAALPIMASYFDLDCVSRLRDAYGRFAAAVEAAKKRSDPSHAFFVPAEGILPDFDSSITAFLCTDDAYDIFDSGANTFFSMNASLTPSSAQFAGAMTNSECLEHAKKFYQYADVEGYRGSPHKL